MGLLHQYTEQSDKNGVWERILLKDNINEMDEFGHAAIHIAAAENKEEILELLVDQGHADVNVLTFTKFTPLHIAIDYKNIDIALLLLNKYNADPKLTDSVGRNALHFACIAGFLPVVQTICTKYPDLINIQMNEIGKTPLLAATRNGFTEIVEYLLESGADMTIASNDDDIDEMGNQLPSHPIHMAAYFGYNKIVQLFLEYAEDKKDLVDIPNLKTGYTPLMNAVLRNHCETVEILLKAGADVHKLNNLNATAMFCATFSAFEILELLLKYGADANFVLKEQTNFTVKEQTLIFSMAVIGRINCIKILLEYQADINFRDTKNKTALHHAINSKYTLDIEKLKTIIAMINLGAKINIANYKRETPLDLLNKRYPELKMTKDMSATEVTELLNQRLVELYSLADSETIAILEMSEGDRMKKFLEQIHQHKTEKETQKQRNTSEKVQERELTEDEQLELALKMSMDATQQHHPEEGAGSSSGVRAPSPEQQENLSEGTSGSGVFVRFDSLEEEGSVDEEEEARRPLLPSGEEEQEEGSDSEEEWRPAAASSSSAPHTTRLGELHEEEADQVRAQQLVQIDELIGAISQKLFTRYLQQQQKSQQNYTPQERMQMAEEKLVKGINSAIEDIQTWYIPELEGHIPQEEIESLKNLCNKVLEYCQHHNWEPISKDFDEILVILKPYDEKDEKDMQDKSEIEISVHASGACITIKAIKDDLRDYQKMELLGEIQEVSGE